jgi:hypothetical protein
MKPVVRLFGSLCILLTLAANTGVFAQAWPSKPVTLMVPFAPGGTTDIVAKQWPLAPRRTEREFGGSQADAPFAGRDRSLG